MEKRRERGTIAKSKVVQVRRKEMEGGFYIMGTYENYENAINDGFNLWWVNRGLLSLRWTRAKNENY